MPLPPVSPTATKPLRRFLRFLCLPLLSVSGATVLSVPVQGAYRPWLADASVGGATAWNSHDWWRFDLASFDAQAGNPGADGVLLSAAVSQTWMGGPGSWGGATAWSGTTWGTGNVAVFNATAGTVTLSGTDGAAPGYTASGLTFNVGGYTLATGTLNLNTGSVIATNNGGTTTFASDLVLAGAAGVVLTKTGSGTLQLAPPSGTGYPNLGTAASPASWTVSNGTYSAATGLFDNVLSISLGNNLGATPTGATTQLTLDSGTLEIRGNGTTNTNTVGSTRTFVVNDTGSATTGGAIHDVSGYSNQLNNAIADNAGSSSSLYLSNTGATTLTLAGVISGSGSLTWNGTGTLLLSATNTYTGGTTINAGTISFSAGANLGANSGAVTLAGGTLSDTGNLGGSATAVFAHNLATGTVGGTLDVPTGAVLGLNYFGQNTTGNLTGSGPITKTGGGQLIVSGNNGSTGSNYTGNWTVNGGLLEVQYNGSTSLGTGSVTLAAGSEMSLNYANTISNAITSAGGTLSFAVGSGGIYSGAITLVSGTTTTIGLRDFYSTNIARSGTITGVIGGTGGLSLSGGGMLTLNPGNNGGTTGNTFSGGVTLNTGSTLGLYAGPGLGAAPAAGTTTPQVTFAGNSTLQFLASPTATILSTRIFSIGTGVTATFDTQAFNAGIAGVIQGNGSLLKIGGGTLTLTGANTYTGGTTLTAGALAINTDASLGTGMLTFNGGTLASVQTAGITMTRTLATGTTGGTIQLDNGASNSGSNKVTLGTTGQLTGSGPLTVTNNGELSISAANTGYSGNWTLNGGVVELTNNNAAGSGSFTINNGAELTTLGSQLTNAITLNGGRIAWDFYSGTGDYQGPVKLLGGGGIVSLTNFYATSNSSGNAISGTISGAISGVGGLTTSDLSPTGFAGVNGTLTLTGNNSYTGGTTVGLNTTLLLGSATALGATTGPLAVTGFLALNGYSPTVGVLTLTGTPTTSPVSDPKSGTPGSATLAYTFGASSVETLSVASVASLTGTNDLQFNPAALTTPGTYTLVTSRDGTLGGAWEFAGAENMTAAANSLIVKSNGGSQYSPGSYYRLTLGNTGGSETVTVSTDVPNKVLTIFPFGSSITAGTSAQSPYNGGGYRSQLYLDLSNDGRFIPNFVGSSTNLTTTYPNEGNILASANQLANEGHPGWTTLQMLANLNMYDGEAAANGGFWLKPGNGENPNDITVNIGGNDAFDYGTTAPIMAAASQRLDAIVSEFNTLRPGVATILSTIGYRGDTGTNGLNPSSGLDPYYNPAMVGIVFNHVLAGQNVSLLDLRSVINYTTDIGTDKIHPTQAGYDKMANAWYQSIIYGQAYFTGSQGTVWNTVNGSSTNFDLDAGLTTDRGAGLNASATNTYDIYPDVYFSSNTAALNTTLGADTTIRSLNFTSGATGSVTVGAGNTLTIGSVDTGVDANTPFTLQNSGGITVQAGTGAHTIAADIALGADQTWGNVSSNNLTVTGGVSGAHNLTFVGSYTVYNEGTYTANPGNPQQATFTTTPQTVSGTGGFVLSGNASYTGTTTISNVTLTLDNAGTTTARLSGTSGITLNPGGTLLLASSGGTSTDRVNNNATLTMAGGTFNTGGLSEGTVSGGVPTPGIGALTLSATSVLDLGAGASVVTFANSSATAWTNGATLKILDWTGNPSGGGTDQVYFGSNVSGLSSSQLAQVSFYSDAGSTFLGYGGILANGEIVPVPEPATVVGAMLLVGVLGYHERRRLRRMLTAFVS